MNSRDTEQIALLRQKIEAKVAGRAKLRKDHNAGRITANDYFLMDANLQNGLIALQDELTNLTKGETDV